MLIALMWFQKGGPARLYLGFVGLTLLAGMNDFEGLQFAEVTRMMNSKSIAITVASLIAFDFVE